MHRISMLHVLGLAIIVTQVSATQRGNKVNYNKPNECQNALLDTVVAISKAQKNSIDQCQSAIGYQLFPYPGDYPNEDQMQKFCFNSHCLQVVQAVGAETHPNCNLGGLDLNYWSTFFDNKCKAAKAKYATPTAAPSQPAKQPPATKAATQAPVVKPPTREPYTPPTKPSSLTPRYTTQAPSKPETQPPPRTPAPSKPVPGTPPTVTPASPSYSTPSLPKVTLKPNTPTTPTTKSRPTTEPVAYVTPIDEKSAVPKKTYVVSTIQPEEATVASDYRSVKTTTKGDSTNSKAAENVPNTAATVSIDAPATTTDSTTSSNDATFAADTKPATATSHDLCQ